MPQKWDIKWTRTAQRHLEKIAKKDKNLAQRIVSKIDELSQGPFAYIRRLSGHPLYKLRVGNYRVLMSIESEKMIILVVELGHRSKIYK